jgi:hypothetical protein
VIKKLGFFFFLLPLFLFSQEGSIIKGKIISGSQNLEGVHVINRSQKIGTITLQGGYFVIKANVSDTIIFSAVHLEAKQHIIRKEDFVQDLLFIHMEMLTSSLDEVVITQYKNINAVALGIVPAGQRTYTPAERKLYAAGKFKWYSPLLIPLGGMSVDGLVNSISGRTKMLKKELQIERKEILLESLKSDFSDSYLIDKLSIPKDYINGFLYYIVERENFIRIYKTNNKSAIEFLLIELSVEYLKLLNLNVTKDVKKKN